MINYKFRPAILSKPFIEFFKNRNISILSKYDFITDLDDSDLVSINLVAEILNLIEGSANNNYSYFDLVDYIENRIRTFFEPLLINSSTAAERLARFYTCYQGNMASCDWSLEESTTSLSLIANRGEQRSHSKYDDIIIYFFIKKLVILDEQKKLSDDIIKLSFERSFYYPHVSTFKNTSFSNKKVHIEIKKTHKEIENKIKLYQPKSKVSLENQVIAAANMLPPNYLDVTSLAFNLSMSTRSLQRLLKKHELCPKNIVQLVKFNAVKRKLVANNGNIKKTAYECGFHDQRKLTRLFNLHAGISPKEWFKNTN
ncbi:helix-turn-helix transcriptional regulator [Shewanella sp. 0m-11]